MTNTNPYRDQPDKSFWSRSVSEDYLPSSLINENETLLKLSDKVVSAGSCFASNLIPYIESAGIKYVRTEILPKIFSEMGENLGYSNFSAMYGNIYTARQLLQLYQRALNKFEPVERYWVETKRVVDPFRPGLKFPAESIDEFLFLNKHHLSRVKLAFEQADVFVFTFGLTEAWVSSLDGAVFPACPGTIAGKFDPKKHEFKNFSTKEIIDDMSSFIELLRANNKKVRFILSVSPVPLVATATNQHVLRATMYSKSVLRVAAEELTKNFKSVTYFPAYEIVTGIPAPKDFFESDLRNVSQHAVEVVMNVLLGKSDLSIGLTDRIKNIFNRSNMEDKSRELSALISKVDCDEVMQDQKLID